MTYYPDPRRLASGDDVRIYGVVRALADAGAEVHLYTLDGSIARPFHSALKRLLPQSLTEGELSPAAKTVLPLDEVFAAFLLRCTLRKYDVVYVAGTRSIMPLLLRAFKAAARLVFDPLANYARTLILKSTRNPAWLVRLALFLALNKRQLKASDIVVYPTREEAEEGKAMGAAKVVVLENPPPFCYDPHEYAEARRARGDWERLWAVLAAGGKGPHNREAVEAVIRAAAEVGDRVRIFVTGPWLEYRARAPPWVEVTGPLSVGELKRLLAMADLGLSPVYSHASGSFVKVQAYLAAGLDIVASPQSLHGVDPGLLARVRVWLTRSPEDLARALEDAAKAGARRDRGPLLDCESFRARLARQALKLLRELGVA